jgi:hypothetical protein
MQYTLVAAGKYMPLFLVNAGCLNNKAGNQN